MSDNALDEFMRSTLRTIANLACSEAHKPESRLDAVAGVLEEARAILDGLSVELRAPTPIEDKFADAMRDNFDRIVFVDWTSIEQFPSQTGEWPIGPMCFIAHQVNVPNGRGGLYRLDFLMAAIDYESGKPIFVAVECDGHDFHEKTKEQAASDKRRDRFLTAIGITVLRFTGSEIHANASACADEALEILASRQYETVDALHRQHIAKQGATQ